MEIEKEKIEWISKEEAQRHQLSRGRTGWRIDLIQKLVDTPDKEAIKVQVSSANVSLTSLRKRFENIDMFSRTIDGKKFIFAMKK